MNLFATENGGGRGFEIIFPHFCHSFAVTDSNNCAGLNFNFD